MSDEPSHLTEDELAVLSLLAQATNAFADLPEHHPTDITEWAQEIHHLQLRVMARAAIRGHPDKFTPMQGPWKRRRDVHR